jgi:hypothetical protein
MPQSRDLYELRRAHDAPDGFAHWAVLDSADPDFDPPPTKSNADARLLPPLSSDLALA